MNSAIELLKKEVRQLLMTLTHADEWALVYDVPPTPKVKRFEEIMREILRIDPLDTDALYYLIFLGAPAVNDEEKLELAWRQVQVCPTATTFNCLAELLIKKADFATAISQIEKGLAAKDKGRKWKSDFDLAINLAVAKANLGQLSDALEWVELALGEATKIENTYGAKMLRDQLRRDIEAT